MFSNSIRNMEKHELVNLKKKQLEKVSLTTLQDYMVGTYIHINNNNFGPNIYNSSVSKQVKSEKVSILSPFIN
jgi:cytidine deaminase